MNVTDKRKQSLYFSREMLAEICAEARRQDRSRGERAHPQTSRRQRLADR